MILSGTRKKITISVAIVFYNPSEINVKQTLKNIKLLNSIESFDFNFYLIDNASSNTKLSLKLHSNNIYIKHLKKNNGFGSGHNSVLGLINSDFHIIMNPDIVISDLKGFINAINFIQSHKNVAMLSPLVRNKSDGKIQYLNRKEPTIFDLFIRFLGPTFFSKRQAAFVKKDAGYNGIQPCENATGSFMIIRTIDFKNVGGFDNRFFMYFEDTDLTKRLSKKGKILFYPYLTVIHAWKRDNHSIRGIIPMIKSMILYFNKWGWRWI